MLPVHCQPSKTQLTTEPSLTASSPSDCTISDKTLQLLNLKAPQSTSPPSPHLTGSADALASLVYSANTCLISCLQHSQPTFHIKAKRIYPHQKKKKERGKKHNRKAKTEESSTQRLYRSIKKKKKNRIEMHSLFYKNSQ